MALAAPTKLTLVKVHTFLARCSRYKKVTAVAALVFDTFVFALLAEEIGNVHLPNVNARRNLYVAVACRCRCAVTCRCSRSRSSANCCRAILEQKSTVREAEAVTKENAKY